MDWYMKKKHYEVIPVIEDLMPYYKGSDTAERLYFMLADCYFFNKEYMVAAYHFKTFRDLYPRSYKAEVAAYKIAECYRSDVPRIELEQTDTEKAIEYYKNFLSEYPKSGMAELASDQIIKLKRNLELKALSAADLYFHTQNYRAAAVTYKNVVTQYPSIKEYENLMYKIVYSYYMFAEKSILTKQSDRYEKAMSEGQNFLNRFPDSKYLAEIKSIVDKSKINILESSLKNAMSYYIIDERPLYFNQALDLFNEFSPEMKSIPESLSNYKNKCYLGVIKSQYIVLEEQRTDADKKLKYQLFIDNYYKTIDKFTKGDELYEAEELFKKANQYYKS
jgi:outer membrane protein assembly factor BamD